jgi:hypothetical protein
MVLTNDRHPELLNTHQVIYVCSPMRVVPVRSPLGMQVEHLWSSPELPWSNGQEGQNKTDCERLIHFIRPSFTSHSHEQTKSQALFKCPCHCGVSNLGQRKTWVQSRLLIKAFLSSSTATSTAAGGGA